MGYPPITKNFLPSWEGVTGSADLVTTAFYGLSNTSLSGASNDAGLWLLAIKPGEDNDLDGLLDQEVVRLKLTDFDPGQAYSLDFSATILQQSSGNWRASSGSFGVSIDGADISSWNSSLLSDSGDADGVNQWVVQSLVFTPTRNTVSFLLNPASLTTANALPDDPRAARFGIDGFSAKAVP